MMWPLVGAAEVLALLLVLCMPLAQSASPVTSRECSVFLLLVIAIRWRLSTIFLCVFGCCYQQRGDSLRAPVRPERKNFMLLLRVIWEELPTFATHLA